MKNYLLLFTFFIGMLSYGQKSGQVVIYSNTGQKFYVVLNGVRQNIKAETNVKVEGLTNEWYGCKVIAENNSFNLEKNIMVKYDTLITYRIIDKKGKFKLRFYSETPLTSAPAQPDQTVVTYSPVETTGNENVSTNTNSNTNTNVGTTEVTEVTTTTTTTTTTTGTGTNTNMSTNTSGGNENVSTTTTVNEGNGGTTETVSIDINVTENGMGADMNVTTTGTGTGTESMNTTTTTSGTGSENVSTTTTTSGGNGESTYYEETTTTTTTTTTYSTTGANEGNMYQDDDMTVTLDTKDDCYMSDTEFEDLKKSVEAESFADDKRRTANMAAKNKCMSTQQIEEIAKLFAFSDDKMSFVKTAYNNCTNQSDYYQLMDVFEFSDDKEELEQFINSK